MFEYLKEIMSSESHHSSKRFALIVCTFVAGFIGLCVGIVLLYDTLSDGVVDTDLGGLGTLLVCAGGLVAGGGINKAVSDMKNPKKEETKGGN